MIKITGTKPNWVKIENTKTGKHSILSIDKREYASVLEEFPRFLSKVEDLINDLL